MDSLRICHVIHNTEFGGTEAMLHKIVSKLSSQHEMQVISLMRCGEVGNQIRELGVPVHAIECVRDRKPRPERLAGFVKALRSFKPDVVQTWAYHADLCGGIAAKLATKAAVVWNIRHATLDPHIDSKNVLRSARLCGRLSRWVPDRILLNALAAIEVHEEAGYDRDKMRVIANGFDVDRFCPAPDQKESIRRELKLPTKSVVLGMCGRFHPHKGQSQFVKVARRLVKDWPSAHFLIAGNGCDENNVELTTWIENAGLAPQFRLLGPRGDIPRVLNAMDVYLLPSVTEGMPNAIGEAMACGLPVVSTDVGDAGRLLNDCGEIVPADNIPAMTAAVHRLFEKDVAQRTEQGERSRARIRDEFSLDAIANQYDEVWRETYERRNSRSKTRIPTLTPRKTIPMHTGVAAAAQPPLVRPKLVHVTTIPMTQYFFLRGQNQFMLERGFDVHAISSPGEHMQHLRERDGVTTHEVSVTRQITPLRDIVSAYRLYRTFRKLQPEIVQLSTPKAALLGAIAAKAARVPVRIYQVRGLSSESETGAKRIVFQRLERATAKLCNGYLVNAKSLLEYAQRANILQSGIVAGMGMSNGVDITRFNPAQTQHADMRAWDKTWTRNSQEKIGPVIGYVGRLTRDKGLEELHSSWQTLRKEFPDSRLLLVGPWESENATSDRCRSELESDPRVVITGMQREVAGFYKHMDVFAFPSHGTEGFPNAPMEAASMGLPVIATRVVGCVDAVVNDVTGRIISPRSAVELESALRNYLQDDSLRKEHGNAGRRRIESGFRPQDLWSEFHDYYLHLLRREGLAVPTRIEEEVATQRAA